MSGPREATEREAAMAASDGAGASGGVLVSTACSSDYLAMSAVEMISLLRNGVVTSLELIDVVEQRIAATNDLVHATPILCFDRAREAAAALVHPPEPPPG